MTSEAILNKAIQKAIENGWPIGNQHWLFDMDHPSFIGFNKYYAFIFSHGFAKAFWGDTPEFHSSGYQIKQEMYPFNEHILKAWEYHLQQMVLEEDPIKYLERFL